MPRLLVFAPCLKAILDANDGTMSIVSILAGLTMARPEGVTNSNALIVSPLSWSVGVLWERMAEDEGQRFEQRVTVIDAHGQTVTSIPTVMTMDTPAVSSIANIHGFPVGVEGTCIVNLELRNITQEMEEHPWEHIASYPITLTFLPPSPTM